AGRRRTFKSDWHSRGPIPAKDAAAAGSACQESREGCLTAVIQNGAQKLESDASGVVSTLRGRTSRKGDGNGIRPITEKETKGACSVVDGSEREYLAMFIGNGFTKIDECAATRRDLIGRKDGCNTRPITTVDTEIGGSAGHAGKKDELTVFVNDR